MKSSRIDPDDLPTRAELARDAADDRRRPKVKPDPEFSAWLAEQLRVQCAGCGFEFNQSCEVCHPF